MPATRFSPDWHRGDASTFARLVGASAAAPVNHQDPVHQARIEKYERNIEYYQGAQYNHVNLQAAQSQNFLDMRVNYTSIAQRSIDLKADWLFGKPVGINVVPQEAGGSFTNETNNTGTIEKKVKDRVNQIREFNHSIFWDYVMSSMGMVCFSGETMFITDEGIRRLDGAAGETVNVLTDEGFEPALVSCFGISPTLKLRFRPVQQRTHYRKPGELVWSSTSPYGRDIESTPSHEWRMLDGSVKRTDQLTVGDVVRGNRAKVDKKDPLYLEGLQHGFIFGDGTLQKITTRGRRHEVDFFGDKDERVAEFFPDKRFYEYRAARYTEGVYRGTATLYATQSLKTLPDNDSTPEYLAGFVDGWVAADGNQPPEGTKQAMRVRSSDHAALAWLEDIAPLAGYLVTGKGEESNTETNKGSRTNKLRWLYLQAGEVHWRVASVVLGATQPVYCATTMSEKHEFTLAGGVYTRNCGDFFALVDADVDDEHPTIVLVDPSYCFPDYPNDVNKPMRACQIQYSVDVEGDPTHEEGFRTRFIVEDYRLEVVGSDINADVPLEELVALTDEEVSTFYSEDGSLRPEIDEEGVVLPDPEDLPRLTCVYRKFEDGILVENSTRDFGIPAVPIVHGKNSNIWNTRYGNDEVSMLIPLIEKYNEMYFYAERVGRQNAHAKLFITGTKSETSPLKSDFDDVIYAGENADAKVITLPTDTQVLKMVTETIEREMHRAAGIPVIAEGEAEVGYGAPSGLALLIRFGPLQALNKRHQLTYGDALSAVYVLCLMLDEMVIQGQPYGEIYEYGSWKFKFDWYDAMPKALSEMVSDMQIATGGKPLVSVRTAQEFIPGVDPDQEQKRLQEEVALAGQQSLDTLATGDGSTPSALGPDGLPLPQAPPGTFPTSWVVNKKVIRDEFGRIDYVEETITPKNLLPALNPQDPSQEPLDLFGLTGPPAALPAGGKST